MITYDGVNYLCAHVRSVLAQASLTDITSPFESGNSNVDDESNEKTKGKHVISEILLRFGIVPGEGTS